MIFITFNLINFYFITFKFMETNIFKKKKIRNAIVDIIWIDDYSFSLLFFFFFF